MIIAIDPGAGGGIAWRSPHETIHCVPMPATVSDIKAFLRALDGYSIAAWTENVGGYMPGNSGPAAVKFARHVGNIEGLLVGLDIPFQRVAPQTWMKALGTPPKDKTTRKNWIKSRMQERYPHLKITLKTSDALGILTWALERKD